MNPMEEILKSKRKPKEKVTLIKESILEDRRLYPLLIEVFKTGSDVWKGTCADVTKHVSKEKPEIVAPHLDTLIEYITDKAPRVKWGIPESIGNLAQKYPKEVERAIPRLLKNAGDESTVVRWCAAFALCQIALYNVDARKILLPKFNDILRKENNNGVRNVYVKALEACEK